jgi:hypothetical protein
LVVTPIKVWRAVRGYVLVAAAACLVIGCGESAERREAKDKTVRAERDREAEAHIKRAVADLGAPYKADTTWSTKPFLWTAEVQDRLIRADKVPIAGIAKFFDISRDGDAYLVHLRHGDWPDTALDLLLKTTRREVPATDDWPILGEKLGNLAASDYAFVARITRVRREDARRGEDTYRRWIAEGDCLDLRPMPPPPKQEGSGKRR